MQVTTSKYDNFVNSINSEQTKDQYEYSLAQFLKHCQIDLDSFLRLSQQEISDYIVNYLVNKKVSKQYKIVIFSAIKHACVMNDTILDWDKIKKFISSLDDHIPLAIRRRFLVHSLTTTFVFSKNNN